MGRVCLVPSRGWTRIGDHNHRDATQGLRLRPGIGLANEVDLVAVAKRKRKQHHWSTFNRVQSSFRLMAASNNSIEQGQLVVSRDS